MRVAWCNNANPFNFRVFQDFAEVFYNIYRRVIFPDHFDIVGVDVANTVQRA
jgi:hypothetical protein